MTKEQFITWAISKGWNLDKFGHLQKKVGDKEYRFKISNISVRYEVKVHFEGGTYSGPKAEWMRLRSGYFKNLTITDEGKLMGLRQ